MMKLIKCITYYCTLKNIYNNDLDLELKKMKLNLKFVIKMFILILKISIIKF